MLGVCVTEEPRDTMTDIIHLVYLTGKLCPHEFIYLHIVLVEGKVNIFIYTIVLEH